MNLLCKNILLNCLRYYLDYVALFHYICTQSRLSRRVNLHDSKISFPFSIYFGRGFFYCYGANLFSNYRTLLLHKSSVAFFYISAHGASVTRRPLSPLPIFWFQVSAFGLLRSANNKIPFLAIDQNKNSISENSSQCVQCPKPDNTRPDKELSPVPGESLRRNNSLSLTAGLLYGAMLVCNCPKWFYRDTMAM